MLGSRSLLGACTLLAALGGALTLSATQVLPPASSPAPPPVTVAGSTLAYSLQAVPVPGTPQRVVAKDIDLDGDTDLVVTLSGNPAITLLALVQGPSGFTPSWSAQTSVPSFEVYDLDAGDIDNDGDPDLMLNVPGDMVLRINAGNGTFGPPVALNYTSLNVENEFADMNADGALDIGWIVYDLLGYVGSAKGNGNGTFSFVSEQAVFGFFAITKLRGTIVEVSAGLPLDFVVTGPEGLSLMRGTLQGGPKFQPPVVIAPGSYFDVDSADLDGDGTADIVASLPLTGRLVTLLGKTDTSNPGPVVSHPAGLRPGPLATGDFDGDGLADVAVGNQRGGTISVLLGTGDGGLLPPLSFPSARVAVDLEAADMDSDGDLDLVAADAPAKRVLLLLKL